MHGAAGGGGDGGGLGEGTRSKTVTGTDAKMWWPPCDNSKTSYSPAGSGHAALEVVGPGGSGRPQSWQSVPSGQMLYCAPGPPSSHSPSDT